MGTRPALEWPRAAPLPLADGKRREPARLLVHVTVERSLGPLHVVVGPDTTVEDLIRMAVEMYAKERRRPLLKKSDPTELEMHYNQFSLDSLNPQEKLINLGSRNFFLCYKAMKITECLMRAKFEQL